MRIAMFLTFIPMFLSAAAFGRCPFEEALAGVEAKKAAEREKIVIATLDHIRALREIDTKAEIRALKRNPLVYWKAKIKTPSDCAQVKLRATRALTRANDVLPAEAERIGVPLASARSAPRSKVARAVVAAARRRNTPFLLEAMINFGLLQEIVEARFVRSGDLMKELEAEVKVAQMKLADVSRDLDKITSSGEGKSELPVTEGEAIKLFSDERKAAAYGAALEKEFLAALEVQKHLETFAKRIKF